MTTNTTTRKRIAHKNIWDLLDNQKIAPQIEAPLVRLQRLVKESEQLRQNFEQQIKQQLCQQQTV